jgi:hypothetical protein
LGFDLGAIEAFKTKIDLEASNYVGEDDAYEDSSGCIMFPREQILSPSLGKASTHVEF